MTKRKFADVRRKRAPRDPPLGRTVALPVTTRERTTDDPNSGEITRVTKGSDYEFITVPVYDTWADRWQRVSVRDDDGVKQTWTWTYPM
ncbi:hypothetical protein GCM10009006_35960 [Haloarcula argentinensis]|uniref:Uncharacterized protein n=1 Tax=Haloarcula argentinensis TaxID=43776 RepID=A0A830FRY5_HALAR|nr:hypothetical protein GCM10009006_35960 [Haloarcula argentinensis]